MKGASTSKFPKYLTQVTSVTGKLCERYFAQPSPNGKTRQAVKRQSTPFKVPGSMLAKEGLTAGIRFFIKGGVVSFGRIDNDYGMNLFAGGNSHFC